MAFDFECKLIDMKNNFKIALSKLGTILQKCRNWCAIRCETPHTRATARRLVRREDLHHARMCFPVCYVDSLMHPRTTLLCCKPLKCKKRVN